MISRSFGSSNNYLLRDWNSKIAKLQGGTIIQPTIAIIGDSWCSAQYFTPQLRAYLQLLYGNGGAGYVSVNTTSAANGIAGTSKARLGAWTDAGAGVSSAVNLGWSSCSDISTPGSWSVTSTSTDLVLHYTKQSGGGDFRWRIDSGSWTTVSTANATQLFSTISINSLSNASHLLTIEITSAGSGVIINGVDCQNNSASGARLHNIGFSGTKTSDWANVSQLNWQAGLVALSPSAVCIMLGVNDQTNNVPPVNYAANIGSIASNIRAALPYSDIILVTQSDISAATSFQMKDYVDALCAEAGIIDAGFVNCYDLMGTYAEANARGLMTNASHINSTGGYIFANFIGDYLSQNRAGNYASYPATLLCSGLLTAGSIATGGGLAVSGTITANGNSIIGSGAADLVIEAGGTSHVRVQSSTGPALEVFDKSSMASGVGGEIWLAGLADTSNRAKFASIKAQKDNATANNYLAGVSVKTSNSGNVLTVAVSATSSQSLTVNGSGTVSLTAGAGTITSALISSKSNIPLTLVSSSGTPGTFSPRVDCGAGAAIITGDVLDNSTYNWVLLNSP